MNTQGNGPVPVEIERTSAWHMYRAIVGIGAFCAVLIVGVFVATADRIAENKARFLASAVMEVLPASQSTAEVIKGPDGRLVAASAPADLPVFLGYGGDGKLVGAAITSQAMGYQDFVTVLFAYSFDKQAVVGFKVLESKETPGLGDKVESEPHFLANFEALDARLNVNGTALANPIVTVKQGEKTEPWQIDGITGATITSDAIGVILNKGASEWVPLLEREARGFVPAQPTTEETE